MRPEERTPAYLWDMRQAALDTLSITEGLQYSGFVTNRTVRLATVS